MTFEEWLKTESRLKTTLDFLEFAMSRNMKIEHAHESLLSALRATYNHDPDRLQETAQEVS